MNKKKRLVSMAKRRARTSFIIGIICGICAFKLMNFTPQLESVDAQMYQEDGKYVYLSNYVYMDEKTFKDGLYSKNSLFSFNDEFYKIKLVNEAPANTDLVKVKGNTKHTIYLDKDYIYKGVDSEDDLFKSR